MATNAISAIPRVPLTGAAPPPAQPSVPQPPAGATPPPLPQPAPLGSTVSRMQALHGGAGRQPVGAPPNVKRMPTECMVHWMAALDGGIGQANALPHPTPAQRAQLAALDTMLTAAKGKWLRHELSFADSRAYFGSVAAQCGNAGLAELGELATHLRGQLPGAEHDNFNRNRDDLTYKARLHDNVYGRAFDSAFTAALVANPPQRMTQGMTVLGGAVADRYLVPGPFPRPPNLQAVDFHVDQLQHALQHDPRAWEADSAPLQAFLAANDPAAKRAALDAFLRAPKTGGIDCLALPYVAVKLSLYSPLTAPQWRQQADRNYGGVIASQVDRQDKRQDFISAFAGAQQSEYAALRSRLDAQLEPALQAHWNDPHSTALEEQARQQLRPLIRPRVDANIPAWRQQIRTTLMPQASVQQQEAQLRTWLNNELERLVGNELVQRNGIFDALANELAARLEAALRPKLTAQLDAQLAAQLHADLKLRPGAAPEAKRRKDMAEQLEADLRAQLRGPLAGAAPPAGLETMTRTQLEDQVARRMGAAAARLALGQQPPHALTGSHFAAGVKTRLLDNCLQLGEKHAEQTWAMGDARLRTETTVEKNAEVGTMMRHQHPAVQVAGLRAAALPGRRNRVDFHHLAEPRNVGAPGQPAAPAADNRPSMAVQQALSHGLPWVGGVSGTTNLMLHLGNDLHGELSAQGVASPFEQKDVLLATMMFVNYDGGHSLHSSMWVGNQLDAPPLPPLPPPLPPSQGPGLGLGLNLDPGRAPQLAAAMAAAPGRDEALALAARSAEEFVSDYGQLMAGQPGDEVRQATDAAFAATLRHFREHSKYSAARTEPVPPEEAEIVAAGPRWAPGAAQWRRMKAAVAVAIAPPSD
jgi:hypothetical protein